LSAIAFCENPLSIINLVSLTLGQLVITLQFSWSEKPSGLTQLALPISKLHLLSENRDFKKPDPISSSNSLCLRKGHKSTYKTQKAKAKKKKKEKKKEQEKKGEKGVRSYIRLIDRSANPST